MSLEFWVIMGALALIGLQNCIQIYIIYAQHRELVRWIDAIGEMLGELLDKEQ